MHVHVTTLRDASLAERSTALQTMPLGESLLVFSIIRVSQTERGASMVQIYIVYNLYHIGQIPNQTCEVSSWAIGFFTIFVYESLHYVNICLVPKPVIQSRLHSWAANRIANKHRP